MSARRISWGFFLGVLFAAGRAEATAPSTFGHGARSAALVRADVADADPAGAPVQNAAFAAAPGTRIRLGYGVGFLDLRIEDRRADVADVSGLDFGAQVGFRLPASFTLGFALAAHLPDAGLAKIGFRPGTEPQFVRYEAALQRATFDAVMALRRGPFALGVGAALSLDMGGEGTRFSLGQDAEGTYADAASDISLAYRAAPIVGVSVDLGRVAFGAALRGGLGVSVAVDSDVRITLAENPLNGTTQVRVRGVSGYDPARFVFGARARAGLGVSVLGSIEWQGYSEAPPPVADVSLDVALGTSPGRTEVRFVAPNFRDVLVPRLGIEWTAGRWAARAGYTLSPSPVPAQRGFTSYADATRHAVGLGGGASLGRLWGVDLRADVAAQVSFLSERAEEKANPALPNARYVVSGRVLYGALSVEGAFR